MILNNNYNLPQNSNVQAPAFKGTVGKSVEIYYKFAERQEIQKLKQECKQKGININLEEIKAIKDKWSEQLNLLRKKMSETHPDTKISLRYTFGSIIDYFENKEFKPKMIIKNSFLGANKVNNFLWAANTYHGELMFTAGYCDEIILEKATNPNYPFRPKNFSFSDNMKQKFETFAQRLGITLDKNCQIIPNYDEVAFSKHLLGFGIYDKLSEDLIKVAHKRLALKWHPDKNPGNLDEATKMTDAINNARDVLFESLNNKESVLHCG